MFERKPSRREGKGDEKKSGVGIQSCTPPAKLWPSVALCVHAHARVAGGESDDATKHMQPVTGKTGLVYGAPIVAPIVFLQLCVGAATRACVDRGHVCAPRLVGLKFLPGAKRNVCDGQAVAYGCKGFP